MIWRSAQAACSLRHQGPRRNASRGHRQAAADLAFADLRCTQPTKVATTDISNIVVTCTTNAYAVGGTVTGLSGSGLVLQNNGGDDLRRQRERQPSPSPRHSPAAHFCGHRRDAALVADQTAPSRAARAPSAAANVTSVAVNCSPTAAYTIGGTVTGLGGSGLVLQNNGGDDLSVTANGTFAFATPISSGSAYAVTVKTQPTSPWQTCTVTLAPSGTVANVTTSRCRITCTTEPLHHRRHGHRPVGQRPRPAEQRRRRSADFSANGPFTFATPLTSGSTYAVTVATQPVGADRLHRLGRQRHRRRRERHDVSSTARPAATPSAEP